VGDVDSLHVEIDNLNNLLVGFCFIRSIDLLSCLALCHVEVVSIHYFFASLVIGFSRINDHEQG
jgi:hypothetical protein